MTSLSTTVAGVPLASCIYNASGPRTGSSTALAKIKTSAAGAVLAKSATLESQTGNPQPRTWHAPNGQASMNSEGLPNNGIEYYLKSETIQEAMGGGSPPYEKPYMISISGKTLADNLAMLKKIANVEGIAAVELNLACPNIIGKPIIGYDFDQMRDILKQVSEVKGIPPLGVKLPPYFDGPHFEMAAKILNEYKHLVRYAASINTIGNCLAVDAISEAPVIRSKGGFAGLSGPAVKYTALANVRQMRRHLDPGIDVVGVGGVESGKDAFELILCGATAVQVGTCHWKEGPKCFDRICEELTAIMDRKGYKSIEDFRGKLNEWSKEGAALARAAAKADSTLSPVEETSEGGNDFYKILSAVLVIALAILLSDKFGALTLRE